MTCRESSAVARTSSPCRTGSLFFCAAVALLFVLTTLSAEAQWEPGHSIGTVTAHGKLIVLTLNEGVLGTPNLFDLSHRTLRFIPGPSGYRVENLPLAWDPDFGEEIGDPRVVLKNFTFPFSGKAWDSLSVGLTGSIVFGEQPQQNAERGPVTLRKGGLSVERFAELQQSAPELVNTVPAISVFFKPRMSGKRYFKELSDRAVLTWSLTEPAGGIQDWTWNPTVNRFQAVLHNDGTIELSYEDVAARDGIIGVYPMVSRSAERKLVTIETGASHTKPSADRSIRDLRLSAVDNLYLKVSFDTNGPQPAANDPAIAGTTYRVCLDRQPITAGCSDDAHHDLLWTLRGLGPRTHGAKTHEPDYRVMGSGLSQHVSIDGNSLSIEGTLPEGYNAGDTIYVSSTLQPPGVQPADVVQIAPHPVKLTALSSPQVHFSSLAKSAGPFPVVFESFHYVESPRAQDLTCSVIDALGDNFDLLAYYSDFRIDNPEAGTSSDGPDGGGPAGGAVSGIGAPQGNLAAFCTKGRFQWQFIQPIYSGANQMQEYPPDGLTDEDRHNISAYSHQLAERTFNGKIPPYDYAISQIAHEMGHRWSAFVFAKVKGETVDLGPVHWAMGLQAPAAFPYQRPTEASIMGGGVWQDNFDGTYTQLDDNYYVPATGYSYLDLYLMGLISPSEVPDFFMLRNLVPAGHDAQGRPLFRADRTSITIQDVIAAEGPREPDVDHAQKNFNTGMVLVIEHGKMPSPELVERVNGIRERWIDYWTTATDHRATMTSEP